jgi:hypothetical protein
MNRPRSWLKSVVCSSATYNTLDRYPYYLKHGEKKQCRVKQLEWDGRGKADTVVGVDSLKSNGVLLSTSQIL